jgi:hypothetical protein
MTRTQRIVYQALSRRGFLRGATATGAVLVFGPLACSEADDDDAVGDDDTGGVPDDDDSSAEVVRARIAEGETTVAAGASGTWVLEVVAGDVGLVPGDGIAVCVEHGADWHGARDEYGNPVDRLGGISVEAESGASFEILAGTFTSAGNAVEFLLAEGALEPGQRLWITIGDPATGHALIAPSIAHDATLHVLEHTGGELTEQGFRVYRELLPTPTVTVRPLAAHAVEVLARGHAVPGEPVVVVLRLVDLLGNAVPDENVSVSLYDDTTGALLVSSAFDEAAAGILRLDDVVLLQPGLARLRAEIPELDVVAFGGPVEVGLDVPPARFGQIHGHSLVSDGLGTAGQWYDYARHTSNLDFAALSDHGYLAERVMDPQFFRHDIFEQDWAAYAGATRAAHEPGAFVTFVAYEWTSNLYSDKNVYFLDDDEPWEPYPPTLDDFYDQYRERADRVTVVSHMMWATTFMRATDWQTFDNDLERVVEVASAHGVREYAGNPCWTADDPWAQVNASAMSGHLVADGLAAGHRLGLVCGDDSHTGLPGNRHPGRLQCRCTGMMALRSEELTRDGIWEEWRARHTWGTTGPRVLLDFSIDGVPQGDEASVPAADPRNLHVEVAAPVGITRIEIVRGDPAAPVFVQEYDEPSWNPEPLEWSDTEPLTGELVYYVRIHLEGEDYAWSSPIWVIPS